MKLTSKQAALLSARERDIIQSGPPFQVKPLVALIKRSRELRDKYRQLGQRQDIAAARGANPKLSGNNERTAQKEQLFDRALVHFEAALHALNTESSAAAKELKVTAKSVKPKAAAATKKAAKRQPGGAPKQDISSKATITLPKQLGNASSQVTSLPSRRSPAKNR